MAQRPESTAAISYWSTSRTPRKTLEFLQCSRCPTKLGIELGVVHTAFNCVLRTPGASGFHTESSGLSRSPGKSCTVSWLYIKLPAYKMAQTMLVGSRSALQPAGLEKNLDLGGRKMPRISQRLIQKPIKFQANQ